MTIIRTIADLEALYGAPGETSTAKEVDYIAPAYRKYIELSPYVALATSGPEGLDCSPRGDGAGFVRIQDDKTLLMPDRRGNNRVDSLRNIVRDPRVGLLFMIPGVDNTLRVNGRAYLDTDPTLLDSFRMDGKPPRSVIVLKVDAVYFQCARALMRSHLWDPAKYIDPKTLPTAGQILAELSKGRVGGEVYDREWPERAAASMW